MIVTLGAIVLMLGLGMNVQYALADYGIRENSLHEAVRLQSSSSGGDTSLTSDHGHQNVDDITCSIEIVYGSVSISIQTTKGKRYWCAGNNYVETCVNYDPCAGFYEP